MTKEKDKLAILVDEINTLRQFYNIRKNMQNYSNSPNDEANRNNILQGYRALIAKDNKALQDIEQYIESFILKQIPTTTFNPHKYKSTTKKEDKALQKEVKNSKTNNKIIKRIEKEIYEEIANGKGKPQFANIPDNAQILSISLQDDKFNITIAELSEPLIINCKKNIKGKRGSAAFLSKSIGLSSTTVKDLSSLENQELTLTPITKPENTGKKYTLVQYKKNIGFSKNDSNLIEENTLASELEVLNTLTKEDQEQLISASKSRLSQLQQHEEFKQKVQKLDKLKILANPSIFRQLLTNYQIQDFTEQLQTNIINDKVATDKTHIWNHFNKSDENSNKRYSNYITVIDNFINYNNKQIFKDTFNFKDASEMQTNIKKTFKTIKNITAIPLPDEFVSEILTYGVFQEGISRPITREKLNKMNLILNEFNLNIKFNELPVTKVPGPEISSQEQQAKIDRAKFEEDKKSIIYKSYIEDKFDQARKKLLGSDDISLASKSTHHIIPLKYNSFTDNELNFYTNYVRTAQQNPWNTDGHELTHRYDTAGEYLVTNDKDNFVTLDFNGLRKRFNSNQAENKNENLFIFAPVLQTKDESTNTFQDLLGNNNSHVYISTNKTPNIISIPTYCRNINNLENTKIKTGKTNNQSKKVNLMR